MSRFNIIINEKKYIERIINCGENDVDIVNGVISVNSIIKYMTRYYYEMNLSSQDVVDIVMEKISSLNFSVDVYKEHIAKKTILSIYNLCDTGRIKRLRDYDSIPLYANEYAIINKCGTDREKKLMFTLYILARLNNSYGWVNQPDRIYFKLANIAANQNDRLELLHKLKERDLIKSTKRIDDTKIGLELSDGQDSIVLEISNLDNLGNQFLAFDKPGYKMCEGEGCGKLIKIKGNKAKYCKSCADKKIKQSKMNWYQNNEKPVLLEK